MSNGGIGTGKIVELEPLVVKANYKYVVMNKLHQIKDGKPIKRTQNSLDKSRPDESKKLSIMDYLRQGNIQNYGMKQIKEYQSEVSIGAKSLLKRLDKPSFSEKCR